MKSIRKRNGYKTKQAETDRVSDSDRSRGEKKKKDYKKGETDSIVK